VKLSTRKAIRTSLQVLVGGAAAVPLLAEAIDVPAGPVSRVVAGVVVAAAVVTKAWNAVEAKWPTAGRWLFGGATTTTDTSTGETVTTSAAAAAIDAGP
jgi:hypothetical protein